MNSKGLVFNGSDNYVDCGNIDVNYKPAYKPARTFESWVYLHYLQKKVRI